MADPTVIIIEKPLTVVTVERQTKLTIVSTGRQGIQGPQGADGTTYGTFTTNSTLGGHRAVKLVGQGMVDYVDSSNVLDQNKCIGITLNASNQNQPITIQSIGEVIEPSWNWDTTKPIYFNSAGLLTQTVPLSGFIQIVGKPSSSTSMCISINPAILIN